MLGFALMRDRSLPGTVFDYLHLLVDGALRLDSNAYAVFHTLPGSSWVAWGVLVAAAISLALGQSAILFLNRVRPASFVYALLAIATSLAGGLVVWLLSTWAITRWVFGVELSVGTVGRTLAFACLPLSFGFLAAMPYFGLAVFAGLAFWCLLGVATGLTALSSLSLGQAIAAASFGWLAWQVLERTIGRPVVAIGRRLERRMAGAELRTDVLSLAALITEETEQVGASLVETVLTEVATEPGSGGRPRDGAAPGELE